MVGGIDYQLKLDAISKDKKDLLNYVLQNDIRSSNQCIQAHDLLVCMDMNAIECFKILYCYMVQRCKTLKERIYLEELLRGHWNYHKGAFSQLSFCVNDFLLRYTSKLLDGVIMRTELHDYTWQRLNGIQLHQKGQYRIVIATLLQTSGMMHDSDEAIPQHLLLRRLRLKDKFGDTYIEPFSRESIDDIDPHFVWPSEDGYRFYHLAYLMDYMSQSASSCYKKDIEVVVKDPVTRKPFTPSYMAKTYMEANRIISL